MTTYRYHLGGRSYRFAGLVDVLAKASPARSGDVLAGCAVESEAERAAAGSVFAELPLQVFLDEPVVPYESDDVTRLIVDTHDPVAFEAVSHLTVGGFRDWLLAAAAVAATGSADTRSLAAIAPGLTPETVAAVSKLMRNQDLIAVARALRRLATSPGSAYRAAPPSSPAACRLGPRSRSSDRGGGRLLLC